MDFRCCSTSAWPCPSQHLRISSCRRQLFATSQRLFGAQASQVGLRQASDERCLQTHPFRYVGDSDVYQKRRVQRNRVSYSATPCKTAVTTFPAALAEKKIMPMTKQDRGNYAKILFQTARKVAAGCMNKACRDPKFEAWLSRCMPAKPGALLVVAASSRTFA